MKKNDRSGRDIPNDTRECTIFVFMDEIGELGKKKGKIIEGRTSRIIGFGASVTRHPDKLGAISERYRMKKNIHPEIKAKDASKLMRMEISLRIRMSGTKTYGYYIDKLSDVPQAWNDNKGSILLIILLEMILNEILGNIHDDNISVIVDNHNAYEYHSEIFQSIFTKLSIRYGKSIAGSKAGSSSGIWKDHLQTTDYVAYALHSWYAGKKGMARLMGMNMKRLGNETE